MPELADLLELERRSDLPPIRPGDTVRVHVRVVEGNRERPQMFEGVVLEVKKPNAYDGSFRVRRVTHGVGAASVEEIDRLNILRASHVAMRRALHRVAPYDHVLVDGRDFRDFVQDFGPHTAIVDGDALCYSIACASVVAKVTRDRLMARLALRRPGYGWEQNVGYPTREHRQAIHAQGITPHHRRNFGTVRVITQPSLPLELSPAF